MIVVDLLIVTLLAPVSRQAVAVVHGEEWAGLLVQRGASVARIPAEELVLLEL